MNFLFSTIKSVKYNTVLINIFHGENERGNLLKQRNSLVKLPSQTKFQVVLDMTRIKLKICAVSELMCCCSELMSQKIPIYTFFSSAAPQCMK